MVKKTVHCGLAAILLGTVLTACSGGQSDSGGPSEKKPPAEKAAEKKEPVELVFYITSSGWSEERFMEEYGNAIVAKFPYMKLKFIPAGKGTTIPELIAGGTIIDVVISSVGLTQAQILDNNLQYDITGLIQKNKIDLTRFEPTTLELIRLFSNGGLYGMPLNNTVGLLTYNKDLFDKFGVPYPKDGMTWDETYELAKRMTRVENGVQYRGFISSVAHLSQINQFSVAYVDPKTDKALFDLDDNWKRFTADLARFYQIPGNEVDSKTVSLTEQYKAFTETRTVAMMAHIGTPGAEFQANWDMVTMPEYKERPGYGPQPYPTYSFVTASSKHKDDAFDAVAFLASEPFQTTLSKRGLMSVLTSKAVRDVYGQETDYLKGKNIMARYPKKLASPMPVTPYDAIAKSKWAAQMDKLIQGSIDVNTALRAAAEETNKAIEAEKAKKK
ncbi:carbohydrate ABC transporter substrate-binding protein [Paenibacillus mesophilus]|uniref:ABC transporter substrate-binding protein n=1 Tax=Paenibacillus mesophilus TaxID=2582849 RepID=UPI00110F26D3|nr:ABC transporter substrate-binding protein [Paenibacillus mesophilus]TMV48765.1 carbohydrate ABC transporter substrate-binding protein [Paenibacillus mesophilus]